MNKKIICIMVLLFAISFVVAQGPPGVGPPEEAITACDGKNTGDACSFETPNGEESGICDNTPDGIACKLSRAGIEGLSQGQGSAEINGGFEGESAEKMGLFERFFSWLAGLFSRDAYGDDSLPERESDVKDSETEDGEVNDKIVSNIPDNFPDNLPEYLKNVWDCIDSDVIVSDLTVRGDDSLKCSVKVSYTDTEVIIESNGIPPHDFESTLGCCATEQESIWRIPIVPTEDTDGEYTSAAERGPVAFTVAGVAIYGPEEGPGGDAVALEHDYFVEDRQDVDLGLCGGHAGPGGEYHYHFDGNCLHWHEEQEGDKSWTEYNFNDLSGYEPSGVIGFAFDGYPIYGSYGWDDNKNVVEMVSSYRLKSSGGQGYNGIDDWEYIPGLGDLDECNGHFAPTPDNPEGFYHYHSTVKNGDGKIGFPYFLLCYHGFYDGSQDTAGQGEFGGQQRPPGVGPPPY
ncbi:MAG: YHYH protein [Nanoarchaeota archaeon]|nr:YHYH protein [Nanoarchaeota archaeon]